MTESLTRLGWCVTQRSLMTRTAPSGVRQRTNTVLSLLTSVTLPLGPYMMVPTGCTDKDRDVWKPPFLFFLS